MNLKPINEQVVVVFGASSGIGRETALQFRPVLRRMLLMGGVGASVLLMRRMARHG